MEVEATSLNQEKPKKKRDLSFSRAKQEAIRATAYAHPDELKRNIETILGKEVPAYRIQELRGDTLKPTHRRNISVAQQARHAAEEQLKIRHPAEYLKLRTDIFVALEKGMNEKAKEEKDKTEVQA